MSKGIGLHLTWVCHPFFSIEEFTVILYVLLFSYCLAIQFGMVTVFTCHVVGKRSYQKDPYIIRIVSFLSSGQVYDPPLSMALLCWFHHMECERVHHC